MKILITGANGYIGRRLLPLLVKQGHEVVCGVRDKRRIDLEESIEENITYFEGDFLKKESLSGFPEDIDVAFYLIHSMGHSHKDFKKMEQDAATNFVECLESSSCKQVIYLSGIVNDEELSTHLQSRKRVEDILKNSSIPSTILRAAIIIGSGSASFEIIRDLVEKLPVMIAPRWLKTKCQPIAVRNVMQYLCGVIMQEQAFNKIFDIGGPDVLTYKEMLMRFAKVRKFKRFIISVPVLSPKISSLWLYFVTSTSFNLARSLVESMRNEVVVQNEGIREIVDIELLSYEEAVELAFDRISQNEVLSSWKDALASSRIDINLLEFVQVPKYGCFKDERFKSFDKPVEQVLHNVWSIGGDTGWYYWGMLWKLRGLLDQMVGGVGLRRGRRSPYNLVPGDALDFWRVLVADKREGRLLLYAEMKLPGEAWLEWKVGRDDNGGNCLKQTATFRPEGLMGRLYWYSVFPFHHFIFEGMLSRIIELEEKSENVQKVDA
ncbi:SDR family oxidoreductase [Roseivirga sp. BDSF3-8]|uniref:SDR family oxidoreductase n=1 Tax=Roseivirga sp. BDSF3-8 TaxID=3241598 RepID=UPI0035319D20